MTCRMLALAGVSVLFAVPALAQDGNDRFQPIQTNDALYSCEQLEAEAAVMEDELDMESGGFANLATADAAIGIGTDLAIRAGGAGAARVLGGLGGLGGLARGAMEQQQQAAEQRKEMAQDRWYYLAGVYMGKSCHLPAAPVAAVAPAAVPAGPQLIPASVETPAPVAGPEPVPASAPAAGPALPAADVQQQ